MTVLSVERLQRLIGQAGKGGMGHIDEMAVLILAILAACTRLTRSSCVMLCNSSTVVIALFFLIFNIVKFVAYH